MTSLHFSHSSPREWLRILLIPSSTNTAIFIFKLCAELNGIVSLQATGFSKYSWMIWFSFTYTFRSSIGTIPAPCMNGQLMVNWTHLYMEPATSLRIFMVLLSSAIALSSSSFLPSNLTPGSIDVRMSVSSSTYLYCNSFLMFNFSSRFRYF